VSPIWTHLVTAPELAVALLTTFLTAALLAAALTAALLATALLAAALLTALLSTTLIFFTIVCHDSSSRVRNVEMLTRSSSSENRHPFEFCCIHSKQIAAIALGIEGWEQTECHHRPGMVEIDHFLG
jgi:hypothetical protein